MNCFPNKKIVYPKIQSFAKLLSSNIVLEIRFDAKKVKTSLIRINKFSFYRANDLK